MRTAKLGALFVVFVMAFTAVAASYAHWEETLEITGIMTTDDINPKFECAKSNDNPLEELENRLDPKVCGYWDVEKVWQGNRRDKDVGSLDVPFIPTDGKSIQINIDNAYPCYYAHAFWCVKNYGSAPVLIHSVKLTELSFKADGWTNTLYFDVDIDLVPCTKYYVDIIQKADGTWKAKVDTNPNNPDKYDFFLHPTGDFVIDTQLDPDAWSGNSAQHMTGTYIGELEQDLCIHFENGCRQNAEYDFKIELCFFNWPEFA